MPLRTYTSGTTSKSGITVQDRKDRISRGQNPGGARSAFDQKAPPREVRILTKEENARLDDNLKKELGGKYVPNVRVESAGSHPGDKAESVVAKAVGWDGRGSGSGGGAGRESGSGGGAGGVGQPRDENGRWE